MIQPSDRQTDGRTDGRATGHSVLSIPYILAYKSPSRISRPPKNQVRMSSKITDPHIAYKSQAAFEDLYWMQASLIINSTPQHN